MNFVGRRTILIAPLDWGLGHATRCIPIIYELSRQGHDIVIAADGPTKILLEQEFPYSECLPLKGYGIRYSKTRPGLFFSLLFQLPKLIKSISAEKKWLEQLIEKKKINIVISDNRFGLSNKKVHSIFITHQLLIKTPFLQGLLQKLNYYFINKFDECWIPDFNEQPYLAGILSHPEKLPQTSVRYLGWLSRFQKKEVVDQLHILILLSGPEPQRGILEKKILEQIKNVTRPVLMVRGLPGGEAQLQPPRNIKCVNHLPTNQLEDVIQKSSFVIARSGYSTVMDVLKMQKKSILIPTPGQTEQEYLAEHLLKNNLAFCTKQETFDLVKALDAANNFEYVYYNRDATNLLQAALSSLVSADSMLKA